MAERDLLAGEELVWRGSPSHVKYLRSYVLAVILLIALVAFIIGLYLNQAALPAMLQGGAFMLVAPVLLAIPVLIFLYRWIEIRSEVYEVTTQRIFYITGIFSKNREQLEIYRIKDMQVAEPFKYRLFGKGNILLETSDRSTPTFTFEAVPHPRDLADTLRRYVEIRREQKGVRELDME
jgi:uncharacterized membrane protein YdbT with pleckstrin-like domain